MKTANNPFLATVQNKTSTTSNIDNRHNNTNIVKSNSNTNTNDKGNKKLRRQTISDPHAYIRYIHSLLGDKCISKPCASTLAKSTTAGAGATATAASASAASSATPTTQTTTANDGKSQKQCQQQQQQQQQLQQIGLQFQGITLYDDDVAKSQNNSSCCSDNNISNNGTRNNKWNFGNRNNGNDKRKALENQQNVLRIVLQQQQQHNVEEKTEDLEQEEELLSAEEIQQKQNVIGIEGKLAEQIRIYNSKNSNNSRTNNNREIWMGTYPTTRVKKIPISLLTLPNTTSTITYTTTTNVTRMTPKIAPTSITTEAARPIKSVLRKHHSFNMQPTYIMHKQMHLHQQHQHQHQQQHQQQQHQPQIQPIACITKQTTEDRDVNEIEQQLMTSRYHATFGGPLVFRPLTLNEKHNFKPIARPDGMSIVCETQLQQHKQQQQQQQYQSKYSSILTEEECKVTEEDDDEEEEEEEEESEVDELKKAIQSEEFLKEIEEFSTSISSGSSSSSSASSATITPTPTNSPTLHPAASLEVLEALTQSNPELIYAAIKPGSRLNLHTQLSALNETHYGIHMSAGQTQLRAKLHATLCENENIEHNVEKHQSASRRRNVYFGDNDILENARVDEATDEAEKPEDDFCFYEIPINEAQNFNDTQNNDDIDENNSPNATVILNTNNNNDGQVKYLVKQNLHEIHI